eukprot:scaffold114829_cov56-Phaeocystis_antarctica.AAC.1
MWALWAVVLGCESSTHIDGSSGGLHAPPYEVPRARSVCVQPSRGAVDVRGTLAAQYHRPKSPHASSPLLYHPLF